MADVFISYSRVHHDLSRDLARDLEAAGYSVWWDTSLLTGDVYRTTIDAQIEAAKVVIIIWTPQSISSLWVVAEAEHGLRLSKLFNTLHRCNAKDLPKPFSQVHAVEVTDRAAILTALSARGLTPSNALRTFEIRPTPVRRQKIRLVSTIGAVGCAAVVAGAAWYGEDIQSHWRQKVGQSSSATPSTRLDNAAVETGTIVKHKVNAGQAGRQSDEFQRQAIAANAKVESEHIIAEAKRKTAEALRQQAQAEEQARRAREESDARIRMARLQAEEATRRKLEAEAQAQQAIAAQTAATARQREVESRHAMLAPPTISSDPTCPGRTLWAHNNSLLYLVADGDKRAFYYLRPRPEIAELGVRKGTLLFDGRRTGSAYTGTARRFSKNCGIRAYPVSGDVESERRVVLQGRATRINQTTCKITAEYIDNLEFNFAGCE